MFSKSTTIALALCAATASAAPHFPRLNPHNNMGFFPTGTAGPTGTGTGLPGPTGTGSSKPKPKLSGVTAYYGQMQKQADDLKAVCADDSFSNIVLSFVTEYFKQGGMPTLNLGASTGQPSDAQKAAGATGLMDGSQLAPMIKECQSKGKKVLISLGGEAAADAKLANDAQGAQLADSMWNLFLGGHNNQAALRPFGDVTLDGVDLDIKNQDPMGYNGFVDQMQKNFRSDKSHDYYITASPQCPRNGGAGDASLKDDVLKKTDAVWVQFYNNPQCNHGSPGFMASVQDWAAAIAPAQLWIGAPGSAGKESASNGFPDVPTMQNEVKQIYGLKNAANIGGWMLWDASTAMANQNYQQEVAKAIKADNTTVSPAQRRMHI